MVKRDIHYSIDEGIYQKVLRKIKGLSIRSIQEYIDILIRRDIDNHRGGGKPKEMNTNQLLASKFATHTKETDKVMKKLSEWGITDPWDF